MSKLYAGIGSRITPPNILAQMLEEAKIKAKDGWTLRSGGAIGADSAFHLGCIQAQGKNEIYRAIHSTPEAEDLAQQFHPKWWKLSIYARKLMGRNMMILLGHDLNTPAEEVLFWTPRGAIVGGTGQMLRAAHHFNIPTRLIF